ncbi:hypothetical protein [Pseudomonas shirazensis]|uniref:hypothetical protein n=1 Tax=Pseudomonas shirazensis TaxID=2745494 RepID=UPI003D2B1881
MDEKPQLGLGLFRRLGHRSSSENKGRAHAQPCKAALIKTNENENPAFLNATEYFRKQLMLSVATDGGHPNLQRRSRSLQDVHPAADNLVNARTTSGQVGNMVAITGISIAGAASAEIAGKTNQRDDVEQAAKGGALAVDLSKVAGGTKAAEADSSSDSSEPPHIKQLREVIKQLQKQLAEEQKQLADLMAKETDDGAMMALISAKQASVATLTGQVMAATAQLLEALTKTGGSSAGGTVDTQA